MEKVSLIIPTHNRAENLDLSLLSITNQLKDDFVEIVIIDDGSTDNTKEIVDKYIKKCPALDIKYVYHEKNTKEYSCPSVGWNIGIIEAKHNIIIQSGSDIVVPPGTIAKLITEFLKENCYISAQVYNLAEDVMTRLHLTPEHDRIAYCDHFKYPKPIMYNPGKKANATPFFAIYRKEWAMKIGMYDEGYFFGGGEDCDFVYRMREHIDTIWSKTTHIIHQWHPKYNGRTRNELEYAQNLKRLDNSREGKPNRIRRKYLMCASFNYYKVPGLLQDSLRQQFLRMGHDCIFFDPVPECYSDADIKKVGDYSAYWNNVQPLFQQTIDNFKPDVVLTTFAPAYNLAKTSDLKGAKHVGFYGDMREPKEALKYAQLFDLFFITNEGQAYDYRKILNCKVVPTHFVVSDTGHVKLNVEKLYDVSFAGQYPSSGLHLDRNDLLDTIKENFNFRHINKELWSTNKLYNQSKIIIADNCDMSNKQSINGYTSNRFFNAMGSGSFVLARYFPGIERFGKNGEHFVYFKTNSECIKLIVKYLKDEKGREQIAAEGYRHFHNHWNWTKQARFMNEKIEQILSNDLTK